MLLIHHGIIILCSIIFNQPLRPNSINSHLLFSIAHDLAFTILFIKSINLIKVTFDSYFEAYLLMSLSIVEKLAEKSV